MDQALGLGILLGTAVVILLAGLTALMVHHATWPPRRTAAYAVARGLAVDPGERGLEFTDWPLDLGGGVRLPVWEIAGRRPAPADAPRLVAVFVHGWGQSRLDVLARVDPWLDLVDGLVLYDLRGHGEAEGGASRLGHDEHADLLALLERLDERDHFVLVGLSMGATIALAAARRHQTVDRRVVGVVAYAPYDDFHTSLRGRLRGSHYPTRPITDLALAWLRFRGIRHAPAKDDAARLACPLLVVHGTDDSISPIDHGERIVAAAPTEAVLHRVEGAGHLEAAAVDGERHDETVRAFVEGLGPAISSQPSAIGSEPGSHRS